MTTEGVGSSIEGQLCPSSVRYAVRHMITDVIFVHFKQFVSSDGNEEFGSKWQKAVCRDVKMAEEDLRRFWEAQMHKKTIASIASNKKKKPPTEPTKAYKLRRCGDNNDNGDNNDANMI